MALHTHIHKCIHIACMTVLVFCHRILSLMQIFPFSKTFRSFPLGKVVDSLRMTKTQENVKFNTSSVLKA